jgi:DNA-binding GntR family transcriptional regulator
MDRNHLMLKALPTGYPAKAEALLTEHLNDAGREILSAHEPETERSQ